MTDKLQIPRRHEGEQKKNSPPAWATSPPALTTGLENVSLEAVIEVLIKRGVCTEAELLSAENKLRNADFQPQTSDFRSRTMETAPFKPVQTYSAREEHRHQYHHHHHDGNRIRRWAAKYKWSRRLGGLLFGWKWHRKKGE